MKIDISIEGVGFYSITGDSRRGRKWMDANVQGAASGAACTDDTGFATDIAEGATDDGLAVAVNGFLFLAGGLRGKPVAA